MTSGNARLRAQEYPRQRLCSRFTSAARPFELAFSVARRAAAALPPTRGLAIVTIFTDYYLDGYDAADGDADHRREPDLDAGLDDELAVPLDVEVLAQQVGAPGSLQQPLTADDATAVQLGQAADADVDRRRLGVVDRRLLVTSVRPGAGQKKNGQDR